MNDNHDFDTFVFRKLSSKPEYIAYYINEYIVDENKTLEEIIKDWDWSIDKLLKVALCRIKNTDLYSLNQELKEIAEYASVDALTLTNIVRNIIIRNKFKSAPDTSYQPNILLAARERNTKREETNE